MFRPIRVDHTNCLQVAIKTHSFTGASRHDRLRQLTLSVFCGKMYRWGAAYVECHMDPNISKATTGKERVVAACAESQSTSRGPNRTRFLAVQAAIPLLAAADASKKRNLMVVGGHADNAVDLCGEDNADAKRQCLDVKSPNETRYGSRVTMSERMINTKRIYDMAPV